jgi:hypothetical protein
LVQVNSHYWLVITSNQLSQNMNDYIEPVQVLITCTGFYFLRVHQFSKLLNTLLDEKIKPNEIFVDKRAIYVP